MKRKAKDPNDPEVIEAVLQLIHNRTREDWIEVIKWRPEGYQDPEDEEDPWKEFLEQEAAARRDETETSPSPMQPKADERAA